MPIHDWTRLNAGDFHDFHQVWTGHIRTQLNLQVLPAGYYAQIEQQASGIIPDVLTLHLADDCADDDATQEDLGSALAVATAPPQVQLVTELDRRSYVEMKNRLVIYHASDQRVVAIIEIVSEGNKSSDRELIRFVEKAITAIEQGIHLLVVDLDPPTNRDPQGIHGVIWSTLGEDFQSPVGQPLTLVAYSGGEHPRAYVEPTSVGRALTPMPLFLTESRYVLVPLEETYMETFKGLPRHLLPILQASE
jgi:hypothetical protein